MASLLPMASVVPSSAVLSLVAVMVLLLGSSDEGGAPPAVSVAVTSGIPLVSPPTPMVSFWMVGSLLLVGGVLQLLVGVLLRVVLLPVFVL
jgi:hypothetical protein